jgi:glycosyltransferase involved in cell wall biosynthesis
MKILYFGRDYSSHDHRFLSALAHSGHKVYYLRLERRGHSLEDRPLPPEVEAVPWSGGSRAAKWTDGPRLLLDLKRVLARIQPDLVQAGPLQTAAFLVALSGFRPLLSMSWGYDLLFDAYRSPLWRWVTRYTLSHSALMLGDCKTIRQKAISFGMPPDRILAFPWGVDLHHFTPDSSSFNLKSSITEKPSTFNLLSARGWEPIYGVDVIARAFVQAAQKVPELRLVMLGNGSQAGLLRQVFSQGGVLDRVSFPGQVSYASLPRCYRSADLYLSASHSDGSSISLLEAMACAVPALVSNIPGNREWVQPGENGWWFPNGDAPALAQAILNAVAQRQRLPEMGMNARRTVESRADWSANFKQLLKALETIAN